MVVVITVITAIFSGNLFHIKSFLVVLPKTSSDVPPL
jgi:hypothetical protein